MKTTDEELRMLGRVAAGVFEDEEDARDREYLMEKYGLSERDLEVKAPELIRQLQGERDVAAQTAQEGGYDYDRMKGFLEKLERAQAYREGQEHTAQFAQEHPFWASVVSVPVNAVQGADYFGQLLGNVGHNDAEDLGSYVPMDIYNMHATNFVRTVRGTVAQKLEENPYFQTELGGQNVYSFLYQTGMSMGDFLFNTMLTGNFSGSVAASETARKAAGNLSLAIMGTGAASNATVDAIKRGLSNKQAYTLGAVAGMAEILTEKVSLEALLDRTSLGKNAVGYLVKNVLAEGSEEVASDLINLVADVVVAKDKSQWRQAVADYRAQGYSEGEAFGLAMKDQAMDMGMSFLGGALSGGVMAGTGVAINGLQQQGMEIAQGQKTTPVEKAGKINPGARIRLREQVTHMPSTDYQIPHISMPQEVLMGEDGNRISENKMPAAIRRYMAKLFRGKVLNIGKDHKVYIDKGGIEEYAFPAKRIEGELKTAKMTAGINLDTTLKPAQFLKNGDDDGHHPEATGGWDYFYVMFETDIGIYSGIVNTKVTQRGRVFYDITEIQKESGPSTRDVNGETPSPAKTDPLSSDFIIPRADDGVKEDRDQEERLHDVFQSALADDVTADALLRERTSVNFLTRKGGLELKPGMTQAEKRQAVKKAVERIARKKPDDEETGFEIKKKDDIIQTVEEQDAVTQERTLTPLTQEEEAALLAYKSSESYKINAKLRDGVPLNDQEIEMVEKLSKGLKKLPIFVGTVYRNLSFDDFGDEAEMRAYLNKFVLWEPICLDSYISTSKSPSGYPIDGKYVVRMEIQSISGRDLMNYGNNMEQEVLLDKGTTLIPIEITLGEDGHPLIKLLEVD